MGLPHGQNSSVFSSPQRGSVCAAFSFPFRFLLLLLLLLLLSHLPFEVRLWTISIAIWNEKGHLGCLLSLKEEGEKKKSTKPWWIYTVSEIIT